MTADEAYGQVKYLRVWLEEHDAAYVVSTKVNDTLITTDGREVRADALIAALPARRGGDCRPVLERTDHASTTGAGADPYRLAGRARALATRPAVDHQAD